MHWYRGPNRKVLSRLRETDYFLLQSMTVKAR